MNNICGYSCEHNKGGVCQTTGCNKIGKLTTKTLDKLWLDMSFTKDYIKHKQEFCKLRNNYYLQQKEIKRLNNKINKALEIIELMKPELWNISNKMTYRLIDIKNVLEEKE